MNSPADCSDSASTGADQNQNVLGITGFPGDVAKKLNTNSIFQSYTSGDMDKMVGPLIAFGSNGVEDEALAPKRRRISSKLVNVRRKLLRPFSKLRTFISTSTGEPSA
ncbi:hypothetical protein KP509_03G055800 [Ceratopteris richardii]|uniref:Uncharacterized protein n=1 Tax=Ceratopteris richardii TaxID=49495 RepID=A0A8T2V3Q1_CERRI|nr:hypothetical protein KP509_03G055800 [Ceratopteris richardii]